MLDETATTHPIKDIIEAAQPPSQPAKGKPQQTYPTAKDGQPAPTQAETDNSSEPISLTPNPLAGFPKFPIDALPPVLQSAAKEVAWFCKVPIESGATIALSMAATAIGKKARIAERPGLSHWPALFFSLIAK